MFSSQLLRILQTIPSDVNYDSCVFDTAEQDTIMKENPNATFYDVQSFEANTLALDSKEIYQLDTSESDSIPFATYVKGGEKGWNPFVDDFSMDNETVNAPRNDTKKKDTDSLSDMKDKDKMLEHDRLVLIEEFAHVSENLSQDSSLPCLPASELSEKALKMHADEKALDCELPELMVCYKEVNYHIVKDICVDEGLPVRDKIVTETFREDSFSKHPDYGNKCHASKEGEDEMSKEESYVNFIDQGVPEQSMDKDIAGNSDFEECSSVTNPSKEETIIDKTLPIQEFGTRSFLRSFISSLDNEEDKAVQQPDQAPLAKEVTGNQTMSSTETESEKDIRKATSLSDTDNMDFKNKDSKDLSVGSGNSHDHESENAEKVNTQNPHEQSLNFKDGNMNDSLSTQEVQCIKDKNKVDESIQIQSIISNLNHVSVEGQISEDNKDGEEALDHNVPRLVSHLQRDMGESSFSGGGLITYSGPIVNAGSLSLRSDGSATSGRSFAFPILQSEWNSSPVRMAKADKKRFRKHKGWRSGLLCCRF